MTIVFNYCIVYNYYHAAMELAAVAANIMAAQIGPITAERVHRFSASISETAVTWDLSYITPWILQPKQLRCRQYGGKNSC